jgi:hypothetical protein
MRRLARGALAVLTLALCAGAAPPNPAQSGNAQSGNAQSGNPKSDPLQPGAAPAAEFPSVPAPKPKPRPEGPPIVGDRAFGLMQAYCVQTRGESARVEKRLEAEGWEEVPVPKGLSAGGGGLQIRRLFARERSQTAVDLLMFGTGRMPTGSRPTRIRLCAAAAHPPESDARAAIAEHMDAAPVYRREGFWMWAFQERGGFRQMLPDVQERTVLKAVREGDLAFYFAARDSDLSMAGFGVAVGLEPLAP